MAFLGPKLVLTKRVDGDHRRWWRLPTWARRAHVQPNLSKNPEELPTTPPAPLPAAVEIVAIKTTAATTAKPKMLDVSRPAAVADANSVREWFKSRTAARAGVEIARKEVFTAYCSRCQEQGIESVSSRRFGEIMKGELGVQLIERRKNHFYVGIALVSAPRLVVASS